MSQKHPLEKQLADRFDSVDVLFRAPAGILARGQQNDKTSLIRLVLPEDDANTTEHVDRLKQLTEEQVPVETDALLWPNGDLLGKGVPALSYTVSADVVTLPEYVIHRGGGDLKTTLSILVPVFEAVRKLHAAGAVHGCIAAATILIESPDKEPTARLFDAGTWDAFSPLNARDVLGAGPSPRRKTAPSSASDMRACGHVLRWLRAACHDDPAIDVDKWPMALDKLTGKLIRRRPRKAAQLVEELQRICDQWGNLVAAEEAPDQEVKLKRDSGAFKGVLLAGHYGEAEDDPMDSGIRDIALDDDDLEGWDIHTDELEVSLDDDELDEAIATYEAGDEEDKEDKEDKEEGSLSEDAEESDSVPEQTHDPRPATRDLSEDEEPAVDPLAETDRALSPIEEEVEDVEGELLDEEDGESPPAPPGEAPPAPESHEDSEHLDAEDQDDEDEDEDYDPDSTRPLGIAAIEDEFDEPQWSEEDFIPDGDVVTSEHVLKKDVIYEVADPPRRNATFLLLVGMAITLLVVFLAFWSVLNSEEAPDGAPDVPEGSERIILPHASDAMARAWAPHPHGLGWLVCNDFEGRLYRAGEQVVPVGRFWSPPGGCRLLGWSSDGATALLVDRYEQIFEVDLTTLSGPQPVDHTTAGHVLAVRGIGETLFIDEEDKDGSRRWVFVTDEGVDELPLASDAISCRSTGNRFAAYASGNNLTLVDLTRQEATIEIVADGNVTRCALSPDGLRLAAHVEGDGVVTWQTREGNKKGLLSWSETEYGRVPVSLDFADSQQHLLVGIRDRVYLTRPALGTIAHSVRLDDFSTASGHQVTAMDSVRFLVETDRGPAAMEMPDGAKVEVVTPQSPYTHRLSTFSASGQYLLTVFGLSRKTSGPAEATPFILGSFNLETGERRLVDVEHRVVGLAPAPSGDSFVLITSEGEGSELHEFDAAKLGLVGSVTLAGKVKAVQWAHDDSRLVATTDYGAFLVESILDQKIVPLGGRAQALHRDHLLTWNDDSGLVARSLTDGKPSIPLVTPEDVSGARIEGVAAHPYTRNIVLYGRDGAWFYGLEDDRLTRLGLEGPVREVAFSQTGRRFVARDGVFDSETGGRIAGLVGPGNRASVVGWSGDDRWLIRKTDGQWHIFDSISGGQRTSFSEMPEEIELFGGHRFHPEADVLLRDRGGISAIEDIQTLQPMATVSVWDQHRSALAIGTHAALSGDAPALVTDGFTPAEDPHDHFEVDPVLVALSEAGIGAVEQQDPLAGEPPLDFPGVISVPVSSVPAGARIFKVMPDGTRNLVGVTPIELQLPEGGGSVELTLEKEGYAPRSLTVDGAPKAVDVVLLDSRSAREAEDLRIQGPLGDDDILALVQMDRDRIDRCGGQLGFFDDPIAVQAEIVVAASGEIRRLSVVDPDVPPAIEQCLVNVLEDWRFPFKPTGSVIRYRFLTGQL